MAAEDVRGSVTRRIHHVTQVGQLRRWIVAPGPDELRVSRQLAFLLSSGWRDRLREWRSSP